MSALLTVAVAAVVLSLSGPDESILLNGGELPTRHNAGARSRSNMFCFCR